MSSSVQFWLESLNGAPQVLELPTDVPRPGVPSFQGARHSFPIDADATARLTRFGQERNATLFMVVFAAFAVVLGRYSGQRDLLIGVPVANRQRGTEDLVGLLTNTLVLRADLSGDPNFDTVLARVKRASLGAYAHQEMPLEKLIELLQPARDTSRQPLFQVMLNFVDIDFSEQLPSGWEVLSGHQDVAQFDLTLYVTRQDGGLQLQVEYATDLFADDTVQRFAQHLLTVLGSATADPKTSVWLLPMLTEREERQLLVEWQAPAADYPTSRCVHELVSEQAARTPAAIALEHNGKTLSYAELEKRSNQLAHFLIKSGVRPETPVGLCLERSFHWVISLLAILKAGGAYVPLDPSYPKDRIAYMASKAKLAFLLAAADNGGLDRDPETKTIIVDSDLDLTALSESEPTKTANENGLAYIFFTSGSTGTPKGVMAHHGGLVSYLHQMKNVFKLQPKDVVLQVTSQSFDPSLREVFAPLLAGSKLVIPVGTDAKDPKKLLQLIQSQQVSSIVGITPSLLDMLVEASGAGQLPSLRLICPSGETLKSSLCFKIWSKLGPAIKIVNLYGPTEITMTCCAHAATFPLTGAKIPIGCPIPNTSLYILDEHLRLLPVGIPGELFVGGRHVTWGYVADPSLTAERFLPNPFSAGDRIYRTGDVARWNSNGQVELLGRADDQIKLRGFRIEPGEIEAILNAQPGIRSSAVLQMEISGEPNLVAFLATSVEPNASIEASFRKILRQSLPEYMVPSRFVVVDRLPLTPNGKVDRRALKIRNLDSALSVSTPASVSSDAVREVWREILHQASIDQEDSFFDLGGHSILAAKVVNRLEALLGVDIPFALIFEFPVLRDFEKRIDEIVANRANPGGGRQIDLGGGKHLPLTFSQQRMWFLHRLDPDGAAYNVQLAIRFASPVRPEVLERALQCVVDRHGSLRVQFSVEESEGGVSQSFVGNLPIDIKTITAGPETGADVLSSFLRNEFGQPFDLEKGPVFRCAVLQERGRITALAFTIHHIATDAWSNAILLRELADAYSQYALQGEATLPPLVLDYPEYIDRAPAVLGTQLAHHHSFWLESLNGAPQVLELPTDFPRPGVPSFRGARHSFSIDADATARLTRFGQERNATLFMVVFAAFAVVLGRYSGQRDLLIGVPVANRQRGTEDLVGLLTNTLVLRADLSGDPNFDTVLARVKRASLGAYAHQEMPLEKLIELLQPARDTSRQPLFQVMLNFVDIDFSEQLPSGWEVLSGHQDVAQFDLTLYVTRQDGGLQLQVEYATDLFADDTVQRFAQHLLTVLGSATADPKTSVWLLPMLTEREERQLLVEWQAPAADYPTSRCVHELVSEQAARTPAAIALEHNGKTLSYAELEKRSNQLAHFLIKSGVRPETPVGLCLERSLDWVISLLAILKAGGAYVPLDPSYPKDRIAYILDLALPRVAIVEHRKAGPALDALAAKSVSLVVLGERSHEIDGCIDLPPRVEINPNNFAYAFFTSGSTGAPKGACVEHEGFTNHVFSKIDVLKLTSDDCVAQTSSASFDICLWQVFAALVCGGRVSIIDSQVIADPHALVAEFGRTGVSVFQPVPSLLRMMVDGAGSAIGKLSRLRVIVPTGEALSPDLCQKWWDILPSVPIVNAYGATETSDDFTHCRITEPPPSHDAVPLGTPIANSRVIVVDRHGELTPIGVPGEICVAGVVVGRGYLGNAPITAERFVPSRYAPGQRVYRTGDMGRWRSTGTLSFLGRVDSQVKLRGFRVELGEIEAHIKADAAVNDAVVIVREDVPGDQRLVAYLVWSRPETYVNSLAGVLRSKLPAYMVPVAFVVLQSMPLNSNGKLDRGRLPAPNYAADVGECHLPGRSAEEEILCNIWAQLLGLERVSPNDNFFELGGHSLLAAKLLTKMRAVFGTSIGLRDVFANPTPAQIGRLIARSPQAERLAIPKRENDASAICSSAQQRLWFLHDYDQNKSVYNINLAWRLVGEIRMEALQQAVDRVVQRHESLRTTFDFEGDAVRQMIGNGKYPRIAMADLSGQADAELALDRWMTKNAEAPFDLKNDCLLRVGLAQLAPETNVLHLSMHHIISDGWSVGIFEEELSRAYNEYAAGIQAEFADLPIQYGDYAEWEMGRLTGSGYAASQRYWLEYLKDAPTLLTLPSDLPRPAESTYDGEQVRFSFGAELSASLRSLAKACDATLFAVLMSGFSLLLSRHFDEKDICIGYPAANREVEGTGSLIGFFVNTLVFRSKIDERMSATKLVRHVQDALLVSQEHGSFPFEKIVELKNPQRSSSHSPIFQIMFAFNNTARRAIKMHDIVAEKGEHDSRLSKFDLTLEMDGAEPELSGAFRYKRDLYASSMVRKLSARFEALLDALTRNPERPIVQLSHIPQAETAALMEIGSGARSSFPNHFVDELIKAQADRDPGKVAVVFNESSLTYGELDRASSVIARELAQKLPAGVRVVPLLMSSGVNIVVAMLGAIKAGVAFAPLDAAWPDLRLSQIIDDFHGKYILGDCVTQSNIEKLGAIAILVDSLTASADQAEAPQVDRSLGDTMYVMFTSGSTGAPKGVMVNGAGVNNRLAWMNEQFGKAAAQSVIQTTRLTFDSSIWQIFWPLINGGRTILTPVNFSFDPGILLDLIRLHRVSFMNFVPSVFNVLLEALCAGEEAKLALTSLNTVIMGGEEMRPRDVARFRNAHPHVRVFNVYGPTEATIGCLFHEFRGDQGAARVPIGRPIANTQVYILDDGLRPVAQGVVGQLYISGVCLADGYHRQSALTAEKFIPNPFGPAGSRMYGTGDLVRITDAGAVEYLGRNDWQIKVRGMRIELSEIESAMRTHAAVKDVAVVLQKNGSVGQQLVAYVVIRDEYTVLDVDELGKHARRLIPAYMVPAEIRRLSALPLTPNGKLDRNRLPVDSVPSSSANGGRSRPGSGTEELVSFVWAELLENPRLGLDDDFFALGGHSLLAVQVVQRIRSVLGFSVPVAELFRNPTVRAFSAALNDYIPVRANGMIEVRDSGGSEALSLVHDFTGLANCFFGLSKGLLPEYTLLVFEAAMNQGTAPSTIEELADSYIEAMSSRVTGVVNIGGYSFGALVAFEMARKLRAAGRQVGTVLLIAPPLRIGDKQRQNGRRDVDIEIEAQRALESAFRVSSDGAKHLKLIREVAIRHIAAADKYEPGFLDAECVLLQPEADAGDPGIWATLCARLRQVSIPAGHYEVFRSSHIEGTSDAINSILRQSRSGDSDAEHTATR